MKAAGVNVESYWPSLLAKLCEKKNIEDLLLSVGAGGGGAVVSVSAVTPAASAVDAGSATAPVAEKKKVLLFFFPNIYLLLQFY